MLGEEKEEEVERVYTELVGKYEKSKYSMPLLQLWARAIATDHITTMMSHQTGHSSKHKQQLLQRRSKATTSITTWMTFGPANTNEGAMVLWILHMTWEELGMSLAMEWTSVAPHVSGN